MALASASVVVAACLASAAVVVAMVEV